MTTSSADAGSGRSLLPVAEARAAILDQLQPIAGWERVAVRGALGRVLAEDIIAPYNVPAHDNSAMDGWAVRHADLSPNGETRLTGAVVDQAALHGLLTHWLDRLAPGGSAWLVVQRHLGGLVPEGARVLPLGGELVEQACRPASQRVDLREIEHEPGEVAAQAFLRQTNRSEITDLI